MVEADNEIASSHDVLLRLLLLVAVSCESTTTTTTTTSIDSVWAKIKWKE